MFCPDFLSIPMYSREFRPLYPDTTWSRSVSWQGSRGHNGGVAGATMFSEAIVSTRLTTLTLLCCHFRLHRRFDFVFAVAVLAVFIAVWLHRLHHHRRRPCSPYCHCPCRLLRPCRLRRCPCCHCHHVPRRLSCLSSWLLCTLAAGGRPLSHFSLGEGSTMALVVSLLPRGRFRHGPPLPPSSFPSLSSPPPSLPLKLP